MKQETQKMLAVLVAASFAGGLSPTLTFAAQPAPMPTPTPSASVTPTPVPSSAIVTPTLAPTPTPAPVPPGEVGYAMAWKTTVGSDNAPAVTVKTFEELKSALGDTVARTVLVSGTIKGSGMLLVRSGKTIRGLAGATLSGFGLDINGWTPKLAELNHSRECTSAAVDADGYKGPMYQEDGSYGSSFPHVGNIIIQNLTFADASDSAIRITCFSRLIWIDHNTFTRPRNVALEITRGSDYITASWNRFVDVDRVAVLGHESSADIAAQAATRHRVTYHHNWFDNTKEQHPLVRYGTAHIYNNYASGAEMKYVVGVGSVVNLYVENNNITRSDVACKAVGSGAGSHVTFKGNNVRNGSGGQLACTVGNDGKVGVPPYPYTADPTASVPAIVKEGAGVGKLAF